MASLPHAPPPPPPPPASERTLPVVSRRPVLDRTLRTVGYELIFRDGAAGTESWQGQLASQHHPAYLKVTAEYLLEREPPALDRAAIVLELAPVPSLERRLLDRLAGLRREGFRIVLDDFTYDRELRPLIAHADGVKLDVVRIGQHETLQELERLRGSRVRTLAEGIDSEDVFEVFRDAGVDLFQGLFYERPNLVSGVALAVGHGAALGALRQLQSRGADFDAPALAGHVRHALTIAYSDAVQWADALL